MGIYNPTPDELNARLKCAKQGWEKAIRLYYEAHGRYPWGRGIASNYKKEGK